MKGRGKSVTREEESGGEETVRVRRGRKIEDRIGEGIKLTDTRPEIRRDQDPDREVRLHFSDDFHRVVFC